MAILSKDLKLRIVIAVTSEKYGKELIDAIESSSEILTGKTAPSNSIGVNGNLYANLTNGDLYLKYNNAWELKVSGGEDVLTGNAAPSNSIGVDGNLYVNLTNGDLYVKYGGTWHLRLSGSDLSGSTALEDIEQPVGIKDASLATLSIDDASRTLTVTPVGSYVCFVKGKRVEINTVKSANWTNDNGMHHFYIDATGSLVTTTSFTDSIITEYAYVAAVYWDPAAGKHIYFANEKHGIKMSPITHLYLHRTRGAAFDRGCKLVNFVVDASGGSASHAQFSANSGIIWDEDIKISLPAQSTFPIFYRSGATSWKRKDPTAFPLILPGEEGYSGTRPAYNLLSGGSWSLQETTNNKFLLIHIFATNDIEYPFVGILGEAEYNSKADARDGAISEIRNLSALPVQEFCPVGSVIYEVNNAYTNVPKARVVSTSSGADYEDHRSESIRPGSLA